MLRPLFRMVTASWQLFAIGLLFGLGFDSATEISLFTVAAGQASGGLNFGTVMIFPALFTAGMTLVDSTDSVRLGISQSDPEDLVQPDHHGHL